MVSDPEKNTLSLVVSLRTPGFIPPFPSGQQDTYLLAGAISRKCSLKGNHRGRYMFF